MRNKPAEAVFRQPTGDGLADVKLVLIWLMASLAARRVRRLTRRKWVWAGAAAVQGAVLLVMTPVTLLSGMVWPRLAHRSSRLVLVFTGLAGAAGMLTALALAATGREVAQPGRL